ncbi:Hypothetical protein Cp226_0585 [Corynebacterium pseudotuberculosis]|nr:Hypothetical protein Cp226_0585 [Corynebacterium pseudotuberculosis]
MEITVQIKFLVTKLRHFYQNHIIGQFRTTCPPHRQGPYGSIPQGKNHKGLNDR